MLITENYRELNRELHQRVPSYGTGGWKWAPAVTLLAWHIGATSILDYGAGKGSLSAALTGFDVREYDPAIPGKDAPPEPADLVCCLDVLEHVEERCLDAVLDDLLRLSRRALLLDIACRVGGKRLADGRPAHVLVRPHSWWLEKLRGIGTFQRLPSPPDELAVVMFVDTTALESADRQFTDPANG